MILGVSRAETLIGVRAPYFEAAFDAALDIARPSNRALVGFYRRLEACTNQKSFRRVGTRCFGLHRFDGFEGRPKQLDQLVIAAAMKNFNYQRAVMFHPALGKFHCQFDQMGNPRRVNRLNTR